MDAVQCLVGGSLKGLHANWSRLYSAYVDELVPTESWVQTLNKWTSTDFSGYWKPIDMPQGILPLQDSEILHCVTDGYYPLH